MKVDTILSAGEWPALPDEARRIEEAGYGAVWTAEVSHDPFLPLGVVAAATTRMSMGTSIAVAFARSPMTTAYIANDLQAVSQGRFISSTVLILSVLGLASGTGRTCSPRAPSAPELQVW